jgi:endoglucanase
MNRLLKNTLLLAFCLSLSFSCAHAQKGTASKGAVSQHCFLSVKGTALVDQNGEEIMLRGVSFGWHNWWPRFYNANTVAWLNEDWKCNLVRAAIGVGPSGAYPDNKELALKCLYAVVDAAIEKDMYVIIDWHSHGILLEEAKIFFQLVAGKYKDYPNIIYEIFNEPVRDSWSVVKAYSEEVIKAIREIDGKNIILVGSPHWDQDIHIAADDPITGYDNLMYALHFYAATHKQFLRDRSDYALSKGLPLFVSECAGMEASGNGPIDKESWQEWLQWMNKNKISWVTWSLADKDETCSMVKDTSSPAYNWKEDDLKEWGKIVREELRKH